MKWILGLLLLPTAASALWAAAWTLAQLFSLPRLAAPFLIGFLGYAACHFLLLRFQLSRVYILGHEMTHALAAWMSGARVLGMRVGERSGHVDLSRSSAWIALAPYLVPLYAVGVVLAYRVLSWWAPYPVFRTRHAHQAFLFAMGLALAFHILETGEALWGERQPDLDFAGGVVFSLAVIALANGLSLILALKCLFPQAVSARASFGIVWKFTARCWVFVFSQLESRLQRLLSRALRPSA